MTAAAERLTYRAGTGDDLRATFSISALAVHDTATRMGVLGGPPPTPDQIEAEWRVQRDVVEFLAGEPGGSYWVCEDAGRPVGYGRVWRAGDVEQLTELMVLPSHHGRGVGRALIERCLPGPASPGGLRLVVAAGAVPDLSLYTGFGLMPVTGHWHLRATAADYRGRRAREGAAGGPDAEALDPEAAVAAWERFEPGAIGRHRPSLHRFFARTRTCVATRDADGEPTAVCWVGASGDVGPAVAVAPADLAPVVVAAIDRVARATAPPTVGVYCATAAWPLLARLRGLGFRVHWPGVVMASAPPPGLDRYLAMRPPHLL